MASLLGSLAGGLGKGIGQMAQVREENNRRKQDKQFQINMEERRANRQAVLAKYREDNTNKRHAESLSYNKQSNLRKSIESAFTQLEKERNLAREQILEFAPKDPVTGAPQITEQVQAELNRLNQQFTAKQRQMVEGYGDNLKGTAFEMYLNQNPGDVFRPQINDAPPPKNTTNNQPEPDPSNDNKNTEALANSLRTDLPSGSAGRLMGAAAEAVKPPPIRLPWLDYEKDSNVNQKYRGY